MDLDRGPSAARLRHRGVGLLLGVLGLLGSQAAPAQVVSDGSLGRNGPGVVSNATVDGITEYYLREGDGELIGGRSLFFSLLQMDLGATDAAVYQGAPTIEHLVTRITGGPSTIDGLIRSEIPGADVLLINPDGILFGENARLDVSGDFVASTAHEVGLGETGRFAARPGGTDVLTVDAPERFGFLAPPAPIVVAGSQLEGADEHGLALIGGDLALSGERGDGQPGLLAVRSGRIDLASLGSSGTVHVRSGASPDLLLEDVEARGDITISDDMVVSTSGLSRNPLVDPIPVRGSGPVFVRARDLRIVDSEIRALTVTDQAAGDVSIELTGDLVLRGGADGQGALLNSGSDLTIPVPDGEVVERTALFNDSGLGVTFEVSFCQGGGACAIRYVSGGTAGDIEIIARDLALEQGAQIATRSASRGDAGRIDVALTGDLTIRGRSATGDPSGFFSNANGPVDPVFPAGDPGVISLRLPDGRLSMDDGGVIVIQNGEGSLATGAPGRIEIEAASLEMAGDARIDSSTRGAGPGGEVELRIAGLARLQGASGADGFTGITTLSQPGSTGAAGTIRLSADRLEILDGARIAAQPIGTGALGDAGSIRLDLARDLVMHGGTISTESAVAGGGNVEIAVLRLADLLASSITTSVTQGAAPGGNVTIDPGPETLVLENSEIVAQADAGAGGNIRIVTDALFQDEASRISASSNLGIDGTETIVSPDAEVNVELPELPPPPVDAGRLLDEPCAARVPSQSSTFVVAPDPGEIPRLPDALPAWITPLLGSDSEDAWSEASSGVDSSDPDCVR